MNRADRRKLFEAMVRAVAVRSLTIEELALAVGCTPHEALEVLRWYDRQDAVTITVGARGAATEDVVVRPRHAPPSDPPPKG